MKNKKWHSLAVKLKSSCFSMTTSVILLALFGISIGWATFVENSEGTATARKLVYGAGWFEVLLFLTTVNLIGSVVRFNLVNKKKASILLFHLSFIVILLGAGITRYFGSEGIMHIREGASSNEISSDKHSVRITVDRAGKSVSKEVEFQFSTESPKPFSEVIELDGKKIHITKDLFVPNATELVEPDDYGQPTLAVVCMDEQGMGTEYILQENESFEFDNQKFTFSSSSDTSDIVFYTNNNELMMRSKRELTQLSMMDNNEQAISPSTPTLAQERTVYKQGNALFVIKTFEMKGERVFTQQTSSKTEKMNRDESDGIVFKISDGGISKKVNVLSTKNADRKGASCTLNDYKVTVSYGMMPQVLPFSITLSNFELERYAGSNSPSSYASEIIVTDTIDKIQLPFRIYMNNILKYKGYRFFQSSYDMDEQGTILSVSNDYWGTMVSYIGYFLMMLGMVLTLFNKHSRFRTVVRLSSELQEKRKKNISILLVLAMFSTTAIANNTSKEKHIERLNHLLIQDDVQGRIEPFNTFASDILRKLSKQNSYNQMSPAEVVLGMIADPQTWQSEPLIKIGNDELAKELNAKSGYVSYSQLFSSNGEFVYLLEEKVNLAYQKEMAARNKYDKELINLDERVNICHQLFDLSKLLIFPNAANQTEKWTNSDLASNGMAGQAQVCPHNHAGMQSNADMDATLPDATETAQASCPHAMNMMKTIVPMSTSKLERYLAEVKTAYNNGNWESADKILTEIMSFQRNNGGEKLPSESKVSLEVLYNNINIFSKLSIVYFVLGLLLLVIYMLEIFRPGKVHERIKNGGFILSIVLFAVYSFGLILRWYIAEHAPWSNGYETMIFVGWATSLSGLIFSKKSTISLAVTGMLSGIALMVAGMSWMNPEITNLVPVLKSYWLIIHVAIITSSYGFLAMGALLGLTNMVLFLTRTNKNRQNVSNSIQEISYVIELSLSIGLLLLTIGCFIGAIWANESWGRYWGWDPKETWALVSILVYSAILHSRNIPALNNQFFLSSFSLIGFSSIIMTFFGVNYYLSGMHSYGQGTPPAIPFWVIFLVLFIVLLIIFSFNSYKKTKDQIK